MLHIPARTPPALQRARGIAEIGFRLADGQTRLDRLFQDGQAKLRLPRHYGDDPLTAVLINTAGGVTGGDLFRCTARWGAGTRAALTGQAAERIYRSSGDDGRIETVLDVGPDAQAEWLPQETILFDRARLARRLTVDLAPGASLLMVESLVLGRGAMGETVTDCALADHWRIRRAGRLVHAESLRLDGDAARILAGRATGAGARALATVLLAPADPGTAGARAEALRAAVDALSSESGITAVHGLVAIRLIQADPRILRAELAQLIEHLRGRPMPRPWTC